MAIDWNRHPEMFILAHPADANMLVVLAASNSNNRNIEDKAIKHPPQSQQRKRKIRTDASII